MVQYEDTILEVLEQHDLNEEEKRQLVKHIDSTASCPWFRRNAYSAAHREAAAYVRNRDKGKE